MRAACACLAAVTLMSSTMARADDTIGVSMGLLGNNLFQTLIRDGMDKYAKSTKGVSLQVEDAAGDINRQIDQVRNFAASNVTAIIVDPADSSAAPEISRIAADAWIPLVYVNIEPANLAKLSPGQAFVGSDERESGTMEAKEVCRMLGGKGTVAIMVGDLTTQTASQRTQDVHDVMSGEPCRGVRIVEEQVANWSRIDGHNLVSNWLTSGLELDGVIANNDEMALGAAQALRTAGRGKVVVAGIDATQDGLKALSDGDIAVTVFQDAAGQGRGAIEAALGLAHGKDVPRTVYIPFELVTRERLKGFVDRN